MKTTIFPFFKAQNSAGLDLISFKVSLKNKMVLLNVPGQENVVKAYVVEAYVLETYQC